MPYLRTLLVSILLAVLAYLYRPLRVGLVQHLAGDMDIARQLPAAVNDAVVTSSNPARRDTEMDHERCTKLHNYLVHYGWVASGRSLDDLPRRSFFDVYGDDAEELRGRLDPSLVTFLSSLTMAEEFEVPFYFWVAGIAPPSDMLHADNNMGVFFPGSDDEPSRFLTLYSTNVGLGEHPAGLIYDQVRHLATLTLGIEDFGFVMPLEDYEDLWHPLETVLSNWIEMIRIGKITASEEEAPNEKYGPWTWQAYGAAQVDSAVVAFDRLVVAVENRMPAGSLLPARDGPLLTDVDLDAAAVPERCFVRSFLTAIRVPRFTAVAPGLIVPHDPAAFVASQRFTVTTDSSDSGLTAPPVLLFPAAHGRTTNFDSPSPYESRNPFVQIYRDSVAAGDHSVPAGLYSESVERSAVDNAEEGFRLILPFALRASAEQPGGLEGARRSDGQLVSEDSIAELFQHGFKPFGGEWWRAQRLERLLDRWTELVETCVWRVGNSGVEGAIELFRDADGAGWRDYWISPNW